VVPIGGIVISGILLGGFHPHGDLDFGYTSQIRHRLAEFRTGAVVILKGQGLDVFHHLLSRRRLGRLAPQRLNAAAGGVEVVGDDFIGIAHRAVGGIVRPRAVGDVEGKLYGVRRRRHDPQAVTRCPGCGSGAIRQGPSGTGAVRIGHRYGNIAVTRQADLPGHHLDGDPGVLLHLRLALLIAELGVLQGENGVNGTQNHEAHHHGNE